VTPRRLFLALWLCIFATVAAAADYVPPRGTWATRGAADAGFDPARLAAAVELAKQKTIAEPADLHGVILEHYSAREPGFRVLGPTGTRTGGSGLVVRGRRSRRARRVRPVVHR